MAESSYRSYIKKQWFIVPHSCSKCKVSLVMVISRFDIGALFEEKFNHSHVPHS